LKKILLNIFLLSCILFFNARYANCATITVGSVTGTAGNNGLSPSNLYPQNGIVMYGISLDNNNTGAVNISGVTIPSNVSNLNTLFSNAKLFFSDNSTYGSGSISQIAGNGINGPIVTIGTNGITITGLNTNVPNNVTRYLFLMLDYVYTGNTIFYSVGFMNPVVSYASTTASTYAGSPGYTLNPTTVNYSNNTTNITPNGTLYPQNGYILYGVSATMPGGSGTVNSISFSSTNNTTISNNFSTAKLYFNSANGYTGSSQIAGNNFGTTSVSINNGTITFSGLSQAFNTTTGYYYLVIDYSTVVTSASNIQFNGVSATFSTGSTRSGTPSGNNYSLAPLTVNYSSVINNIVPQSTLYPPQNTMALYGFSAAMAGGAGTVTQFTISCGNNNLSTYFSGAQLYRSTTNDFSTAVPVNGALPNINNNAVTFTNLSQPLTTTPFYYYLVLNYTYTGTGTSNVQFNNVTSNFTTSGNNTSGNSYNLNPTTVNYTNVTNGLTNNTQALYPQNAVAVYGVSAVMAGGSGTVTSVAMSGTNGDLPTYFTNAKLYRTNTDGFNTNNQIAGAGVPGTLVSVVGGTVTFSGFSQSFSTTAGYYYLVLDYNYTGTNTSSIQFNTVAATFSTGGTYSGNAYANTYNLNPTTVNLTQNTNGLSPNGTAYAPASAGITMFSFAINVKGIATFNKMNINSNGVDNNTIYSTPDKYLGNGKLFANTTNSRTGATQIAGTGIPGTAVTFNGGFVNVTGIAQSFNNATTNGTTMYYFLDADYIVYNGLNPGGVQFNFTNGQGSNQLEQNAPVAINYNSFGFTGNLYNFRAAVTAQAYTGLANGITTSILNYGDTKVVFAVGLTTVGTVTINQLNFLGYINGNPGSGGSTYFDSGTLYSGPDENFANAVAVPGATLNKNAFNNGISFTGFTEAINNSSKYYFVSMTYSNVNPTTDATFQFRFVNNQDFAPVMQTTPSTSFNNLSALGPIFNMGVTYDWAGPQSGNSTSFVTASNYRNLNNGTLSVAPTQYDQVRIGVVPYANNTSIHPSANASINPITIGKLAFGSANTPNPVLTVTGTLTVNTDVVNNNTNTAAILAGGGSIDIKGNFTNNAGANFTVNRASATSQNGITFSGALPQTITNNNTSTTASVILGNLTFSGAGTKTFAAGGYYSISPFSLLTLLGTATTVSIPSSTTHIKLLTGTTTPYLTYAQIALIEPGSSIQGNIDYEVYFQGGALAYRNYRSMAAPVYSQAYGSATKSYRLLDLKNTFIITGEGGTTNNFHASSNNGATLRIYNSASNKYAFIVDYKASTNPTVASGTAFYMYYRGNQTATGGSAITAKDPFGTKTIKPTGGNYAAPEAITYTYTGVPNQQDVTLTSLPALGSGTGLYYFVANPYAATLDASALINSAAYGSGQYGLSRYTWTWNPSDGAYAIYDQATPSLSTHSAKQYAVPGQGFFIKNNNYSTAALPVKISESMKSTTNSAGAIRLLSTSVAAETTEPPLMRLQLYKNELISEEVGVGLIKDTKDSSGVEDATFITGDNLTLTTITPDDKYLSIDKRPFTGVKKIIPLYISTTADTIYTFKKVYMSRALSNYKVTLFDSLLNNTIEIAKNEYAFNVVKAQAATWGSKRFRLIIEPVAAQVTYFDFKGKLNTNRKALLTWKTNIYTPGTTYQVQRSQDNTTFVNVGATKAGSEQVVENSFDVLDNEIQQGDNYYRLAQTDVFGNISTSNTILLKIGADIGPIDIKNGFKLFPNPVVDKLSIISDKSYTGKVTMRVYSTSSEIKLTKTFAKLNAYEPLEEYVSQLRLGVYIVELKDESNRVLTTLKFVKQ